jgi:hypothetical protein
MKPELSCCDPKFVPFPSGRAWAHADDCTVNPRQKVNPGDDHPARWRGRGTWWGHTPYRGAKLEALAWKAHTGRWGSR